MAPVSVVPAVAATGWGRRAGGEGVVERGGVEDAGGGGEGVRRGRPSSQAARWTLWWALAPQTSTDGARAVGGFAGEQQGELVGFGAAGGDEGVRRRAVRVDSAARARAGERLQFGGGGGLVPGVEGWIERGGGEVGRGRDGERRAVQMGGAVRVGGVGGACGEGGDEGAQRVVRPCAVVGDARAGRRHGCGGPTAPGPPAGMGPPRSAAPWVRASRTVSSSGRRARGRGGPARGGALSVPRATGGGRSARKRAWRLTAYYRPASGLPCRARLEGCHP